MAWDKPQNWLVGQKLGPKRTSGGNVCSSDQLRALNALAKEQYLKKQVAKLIAALALQPGQSMDKGEARIALRGSRWTVRLCTK